MGTNLRARVGGKKRQQQDGENDDEDGIAACSVNADACSNGALKVQAEDRRTTSKHMPADTPAGISPSPAKKRKAAVGANERGNNNDHVVKPQVEELGAEEIAGAGEIVAPPRKTSSHSATADDDWSDPEAGVVDVVRDSGFSGITTSLEDLDREDAAWRQGLAELRRKLSDRKQDDRTEKLEADQLGRMLRRVASRGDWPERSFLASRIPDARAALLQLDTAELCAFVDAASRRYLSHRWKQFVPERWLNLVLKSGSLPVSGRQELNGVLRPLLRAVAKRLGPASRSGEVLVCIGKWRLVSQLAAARRATLRRQEEAATASAPSASAAANSQRRVPQSEGISRGRGELAAEEEDDDLDSDAPEENIAAQLPDGSDDE